MHFAHVSFLAKPRRGGVNEAFFFVQKKVNLIINNVIKYLSINILTHKAPPKFATDDN